MPDPSSPGTLRPMLALALPVLAEQVLTMAVGYTDWWLTGHYLEGPEYQAAMGLMAYVLWLLPSMFASVAIGATAMIARFVGAGDSAMADRAANQSLLIGFALAVVATITTIFLGPAFVNVMQLEPEAARLAVQYLWILIPVIPAIMIEQVSIACLRGAGDTVSGFVVKTIVNVVNAAVSTMLVVGWGLFPKLDWYGLAIGTACGHGIGGLILLGLLLKGRAGLKWRLGLLRPDADLTRRLLRIGVPAGIDRMVVLSCHLIFVAIINRLGTLAAAAHGLGVIIESMAYLPGVAFQVAAATLAGQYLGADQPRRASRAVLIATAVGGGLMVLAGCVFYFGAGWLTAFFTGDNTNDTARLTIPLLQLVSLAMPSLALTMIIEGGLRGAGDTRVPLLVTLAGFLAIRIPVACLLAWDQVTIPLIDVTIAGWGLGVLGAWYAMLGDVVIRSILIVARFAHGGWKRIKV